MNPANLQNLPPEVMAQVFVHLHRKEAGRAALICVGALGPAKLASDPLYRHSDAIANRIFPGAAAFIKSAPHHFNPLKDVSSESLKKVSQQIGRSVWITDLGDLYWVVRDEDKVRLNCLPANGRLAKRITYAETEPDGGYRLGWDTPKDPDEAVRAHIRLAMKARKPREDAEPLSPRR